MSEGHFTIGIPGAGSTSLASSPIAAVVVDDWSEQGIPIRTGIGMTAITGRSNWGTPQISAPAHRVLWSWEVTAYLTLDDAIALGALGMWQSDQQKLRNTAPLRLIDETDYTEALPSPYPVPLISPVVPAWNAGYVYGFGVYAVKLNLPGGWRQPVGLFSNGEQARLVTFQVEEL
jgi:hypothetical protein